MTVAPVKPWLIVNTYILIKKEEETFQMLNDISFPQ